MNESRPYPTSHVDFAPGLRTAGAERRRAPRLQILGMLHGHLVALGVPLTVLDIGRGGFSMQTLVAFPVDAVHDFRFTLMDGSSAILSARVVHCRYAPAPGDTSLYVTGLEFIREDSTDGRSTVDDFVEKVAKTSAAFGFDLP